MTEAGHETSLAAVDLGASSGRVILGRVGHGRIELTEVHRFRNGPVALPDGLYWDILGLYREVLDGIRAARGRHLTSPGWRSIHGRWTTGSCNRTAGCSEIPGTTAIPAPSRCSTRCIRLSRPSVFMPSTACSSAVQHHLPIRRRPGRTTDPMFRRC